MADISPAERVCPSCSGVGHFTPSWASCPVCNGIGRTWLPGGPSFGCKLVLAKCRPGEIVVLGTGERGRVIRHVKRGSPTTDVVLIGDFDDVEDKHPTSYPSVVGVASVSAGSWTQQDNGGQVRSRTDQLDPLQKQKAL